MHDVRRITRLLITQTLLRRFILVAVLALCLSNAVFVHGTTDTSLTIQILLQSRSSAADQSFEITLVNSTVGFKEVIESDADGRIILNGLTSGNYNLRIKHPQYLAITVPVTLVTGANTLNVGPLKVGDVNNDNQVSSADASLITSSFNQVEDGDDYEELADLNADQQVSLIDFSLLTSNYGQTGAPVLQIPSPSGTRHPSQIINLTNWKITLPYGTKDSPDSPLEIKQPQLAVFSISPWFRLNIDGTGIVFRAPVNGITTSGSNYPRSELREMTSNGQERASWSPTKGTHTMIVDEAIIAVPTTKKHIVVAQIHDGSDDVIVIRLDYPKLYINVDGKSAYTLNSNYVLGERFTIKYVVTGGITSVYYNKSSKPVYVLTKKYSEAYFKAGAYTQSNCDTEGKDSLCNENNFGEMVIYNLVVQHQ